MSADTQVRVVLSDVGGVLVELSGLAMLLSWLGKRILHLGPAVAAGRRRPDQTRTGEYVRAMLCNTNTLQWPRLMKQTELIDAFDHHFASHLTGEIKPDDEAFQHVLNTLACKAAETLFLDDSRLNVAAAKRIGMIAFQVRGPAEAERALRDAGVVRG